MINCFAGFSYFLLICYDYSAASN